MCNTCNSTYTTNRCGCGCGGNASCNPWLWTLFFGNRQSVCYDGCGNIRVTNGCGCNNTWNGCGNGCNNTWNGCGNSCNNTWNRCGGGCGCNNATTANTANTDNGNGFFCTTRCQSAAYATTLASSGDNYYANTYGGRGRRSCGCGYYNG